MLNPAKNIPSFLSFLVELVIYAGFVTGYFLLVLNFLGHWIDQVSKSNKVSYAFLALGLMVVQAVVLGRLTTAVMWVIQFFQAIISALFVIARPHETVTSPKDAPGLLIYRFGGPLLAINADYFARHVQELIADSYPPVTLFLINAEAIIDMDGTGIETLDELHQTLKKKNIELGLCVVKGNFRKALSSTSLPRRAGFNVYPSEAAVIEKMTKKPSKPKK